MRARRAALLLVAATVRATPLTKLRARLVQKPKQSIALDATDGPSPKSLRRDNAAAVATVEALIDDKDPRCQGSHLALLDTGFDGPPRQIRGSLRKHKYDNVLSLCYAFHKEKVVRNTNSYKFLCFSFDFERKTHEEIVFP